MRKRLLVPFGGLAAAVLLLLALPGCDPKKFFKNPLATFVFLVALQTGLSLEQIAPFKLDLSPTLRIASRKYSWLETAHGAPPKGQVPEEYVSFEASGDESFGILGLRRELRHPFRVEVTLGVFDLAKVPFLDSGFVAAELDVIDSEPNLKFITGGVQPIVAQGIVTHANVFVATENGNQGQLVLPGALLVDLAFMSNGTNVDVCARPHGELTWQPVATVARPATDSRWHPFVGVVGIDAGGGLGADNFLLLANGASTATPGTLEDAIEKAWDGFAALGNARTLLEGVPDPDTAQLEVAEAVAELTAARDTAQALLDSGFAGKPMKPAHKMLKKAVKEATVALTRLAQDKAPKSIIKAICKAETAVLQALGALRAEQLSEVS